MHTNQTKLGISHSSFITQGTVLICPLLVDKTQSPLQMPLTNQSASGTLNAATGLIQLNSMVKRTWESSDCSSQDLFMVLISVSTEVLKGDLMEYDSDFVAESIW